MFNSSRLFMPCLLQLDKYRAQAQVISKLSCDDILAVAYRLHHLMLLRPLSSIDIFTSKYYTFMESTIKLTRPSNHQPVFAI